MAARSSATAEGTDTPTPKEQNEAAVDTTAAAAAKGADTSAVESVDEGDKIVYTVFPIDDFTVTVGNNDKGEGGTEYALTRVGGAVVKGEHMAELREVAAYNKVKLRSVKAPVSS